ncbi:uncharacterized protein LOC128168126 isoform X1 [Crassostrea angulata]|uniref:uncharacterized protein LOC128168126 isoform X1 n=1 Tax=Magallana angulata TaxID=2784310 RepID=UPI00148A778F|nr:uncharacterized protein LOC117684841 [Crassostrea gigas]XP_052690191.1 uncharacterized protein LOC128168126 isoform X1 [Crassostrea angulata]
MAKLTPFQKLKRAVSRLSVTSGSKFIQPDFEDSDIEFNANTYRPDFVSESRPDFASGSSKNYKNISQTSPPLFYSNDDLNFNYPSVGLNPHEASSSQAASFERTTFPPFDRHEISRVPDPSDAHNATDGYNTPNANNINNESNAPDLSDAHNTQNLPSAHNVKDGFNAPDLSDAHNAPNASQASKTSNPPQNLPRTSQEFVIPENTAANSQTAGRNSFFSTFRMSSNIKLDKFKGDGSQDVNAWFTNFGQWAKFHDLPDSKIIDAFPFYLEGHAKIWYDSLSPEQKVNPATLTNLFQERFKELENFLDLSVLQMKQKGTEPVGEFLSRLVSLASIKNIPEKVLLSVAMNGLRSDIKTYVVTQNPKTMEQLRQIAILAEKSQPSQITTLETYETLLSEIKNLKEKIETL